MMNRRSVLKIGATTLAGTLVDPPAFGTKAGPAGCAVHKAVFDERFKECQVFAAELRVTGVSTSAIQGDVANLWYDDLRAQLRKGRAPVAGLTDRASLFCLEELARDVGMLVILRVDHIVNPEKPEPEFGRAMAQLVSHFDEHEPPDASAQKRTGPFSPKNMTALVFWILA